MKGKMECDYCGGGDLSFAWSREFTVVEHGWDGVHEYWDCRGCGSGAFVVKEFSLSLGGGDDEGGVYKWCKVKCEQIVC